MQKKKYGDFCTKIISWNFTSKQNYSNVKGLLLEYVWNNEYFIVFSFTINITTSKLTKTSHYRKKQQKLYDKMKELKEVEKLSYKKITDKLEKLKYRSVRSGKI